jgi:hypothetical protein
VRQDAGRCEGTCDPTGGKAIKPGRYRGVFTATQPSISAARLELDQPETLSGAGLPGSPVSQRNPERFILDGVERKVTREVLMPAPADRCWMQSCRQ